MCYFRSSSLSDYELASRLSYFLWSTMPDEQLFEAAATGILQDDAGLSEEVFRMLADEKAVSLVDDFASQWLELDGILEHQPDPTLYPQFTEEVRLAVLSESKLTVRNMLERETPLRVFVSSDT